MSFRYFGTDGIRGRVGTPPVTADFALRLGWAVGTLLAERTSGRASVVIGKDTRLSGYLFESALEAGFAAAGVNVLLLGPMPTPAIAHMTRSLGAQAGVVISASHNPYHDNGIKFFAANGQKLPDADQQRIEALLDGPIGHVACDRFGKARRIEDAAGRYVEYCKSTVPFGTRLDGLRLVVDCANGATYRIAPAVFRELGAEVVAIHDQPDGVNINRDCGSTHPEGLKDAVITHEADLGIAFDGDGDRVIMVDHRGEVIDGDQILYVLASARRAAGTLGGGLVGTLMSNYGLEEACVRDGIEFVRTRVGDRHVHEALVERGWLLGGESSGHILCLDKAATGCGIISALQVLEVIAGSGRTLADLAAGMPRYPQVMINVPVTADVLHENPALESTLAMVRARLQGRGRVVLRPSGTEPVVRVMVEGDDEQEIRRLAETLADTLKQGAEIED